jgi:hypothetical protein
MSSPPTSSGSKLFRNDDGSFTDSGEKLVGVDGGCISWGDCDNDGDLDPLVTGGECKGGSTWLGVAKVYINDRCAFTDADAGLA